MTNSNYFTTLNYSLGNEDSSLEYGILHKNARHVFSISGSGSRIISLLAKNPQKITCVDTSSEQLYFTELRIESLRAFEHKEFLAFWGYPPHSMSPSERKKTFQKIRLSSAAFTFIVRLFEENKWNSLLYKGKWERTFTKLSKINRLITGRKGAKLFSYKGSSEYENYLHNYFPHKAWSLTVFLLGNAAVFNALLYKGTFPKKNIPGSLYQFYMNSFTRLFNQGPARNNFFLQLLFFGEILFSEGYPFECTHAIFIKAKGGVKTAQVSYVQGDIIATVRKMDRKIDFFSFSDVPSYFSGNLEKTFLQKISPSLSPNCTVVMRNYLRIPQNTIMRGYSDITNRYTDLIRNEKVQMYVIKILRKK